MCPATKTTYEMLGQVELLCPSTKTTRTSGIVVSFN